nr:MAG TPA: hypothetical protein [Bacteriophage sp.]DAU17926.1 MAG TPA: hypothetical protein [Bacteriophage sp.]
MQILQAESLQWVRQRHTRTGLSTSEVNLIVSV